MKGWLLLMNYAPRVGKKPGHFGPFTQSMSISPPRREKSSLMALAICLNFRLFWMNLYSEKLDWTELDVGD